MSKYSKMKDGSYVFNCYLKRRLTDQSGYMFHSDGATSIAAYLNGYAIVPIEEYERLTGEDFSDVIDNIASADAELSNGNNKEDNMKTLNLVAECSNNVGFEDGLTTGKLYPIESHDPCMTSITVINDKGQSGTYGVAGKFEFVQI